MKKIIEYNGIQFDSEEERLFYIYCEELKQEGFIKEFSYHTDSFTLSEKVTYSWKKHLKTKTKDMESTLLQPHVYTPDFNIIWEPKAYGIFYCYTDDQYKFGNIPFINNVDNNGDDIGSFIEVKPSFDMNNMTRLFTINQKWMYQEYLIYIQKVIPIGKKTCLFATTFVPQEAMLTPKTRRPKKYKFEVKSLNNFLGGLDE